MHSIPMYTCIIYIYIDSCCIAVMPFECFQPISSKSVDLPSIISKFRQFDRLMVFVLKYAGYTVPAPFCMAAVVDSQKAWSIQRGGKPAVNRWFVGGQ